MKFVRALPLALACLSALSVCARAQQPQQIPQPGVEALIYSTMPSTWANRPEMAMDGDPNTYFKSFYNMSDTDDLQVLLSRPITVRSLRITTGDAQSQDTLSDGHVEISSDGTTYKRGADFNREGVATLANAPIMALRIRLNPNRGVPALLVREITIDSDTKITHAQAGPGRPFSDISQAPDLAVWARRADREMESFWADTQALLYSPGFVTPNKVNIVYRTGEGVTAVAAAGGGQITVNSAWARRMPEDTGLTVHEVAHVIQSMSAYNPVWLIEGVADYVRWVKFEPQNHKPRIDPDKAKYSDSYRTTGTFLAWCEMKYDSTLVTKLNHAIRFGNYKPDLWQKFTGKDIDTLWAEFIAAYRADSVNIITTPLAQADRPRVLPVVTANSSVPVDLSKYFNASGFARDGATIAADAGFDAGGASFSAELLGTSQTSNGVRFNLGPAEGHNIVSSGGNVLDLPRGKYLSLWILGAAVEGNQMAQEFTVSYADGTSEKLLQNVSDWYQPRGFPGESRAVKMAYRNMGAGVRDPRIFYAYSYGFALDANKEVRSLSLPQNPNVKILGVSLAR